LRAHPSVTIETVRGLGGTFAGYPRRALRPARGKREADTVAGVADVLVRRARTGDVPAMKSIIDIYAGSGRKLLAKELVTLYEDVQDFAVAEADGEILGCGALHVLWADLGEIRTLAVRPDCRGRGIGGLLLEDLIDRARELGLSRLFSLTFQVDFFRSHGFVEIDGTPVDPDTYAALRRSYDQGVAEFLGLEYVKPNTLGNSRMLRHL
jgi:amino-acid N-acetyltransferase